MRQHRFRIASNPVREIRVVEPVDAEKQNALGAFCFRPLACGRGTTRQKCAPAKCDDTGNECDPIHVVFFPEETQMAPRETVRARAAPTMMRNECDGCVTASAASGSDAA
jgi:hypothetical protein